MKRILTAVLLVFLTSVSAWAQTASRVTVTTSATLLLTGTGVNQTVFKNTGSVDVYLGGSGVTTAAGFTVAPNEAVSFALRKGQAFYGIVSTGTAVVQVLNNISSVTPFMRSPGNTTVALGSDLISPLTSGDTPVVKTGLTNSVVTVIGSAALWNLYMCGNPNTSWTYVQAFNVSGSVTLGTTVADFVISLPPNDSGANLALANVAMTNAFKVAATTTPTGSTAPTNTLTCTFTTKQ